MNKRKENTKRLALKRAKAHYRKTFDYIYEAYLETESSSVCVSYDGVYKNLSKNDETCSVGKIFVSPSDFIADVEIMVKKLISAKEYILFIGGECPDNIKETIGKAFIRVKLHPLSQYLKPTAVEIINGRTRI